MQIRRKRKKVNTEKNRNVWKEIRINILAIIFLMIGVDLMLTTTLIDSDKTSQMIIDTNIGKRLEVDKLKNEALKFNLKKKTYENLRETENTKITVLEQTQAEQVEEKVPLLKITNRDENDYYPDDKETVATITIPDINLYTTVTYGDSQENIDTYDVVLRYGHRFDQNGAVLLAGHNYKSFGKLLDLNVGSSIFFHSYYGDFSFLVDDIKIGTTDGINIFDENGKPYIDFYSRDNRLYLYTCTDDQNGRMIVSAYMQ